MFLIKTKKSNKIITALIALVSLSLVLINFQSSLMSVSATVIPVQVSIHHLDFGLTFPGENHTGKFTVSYAEQGNGINYTIIQKRKPLPPSHADYPIGGDPNLPGYYRDLCPHLTKVSLEGENDIETQASVGPDDLTDEWTIYYSVPAIMGNVAQDHKGGLVTENGEYGCDISINLETYCGDGQVNRPNEECDDGNDDNGDDCKNNCTLSSICDSDLDLALVLDRSGSMGYNSKCVWWQLKCVNAPSCSQGYKWVQNITYNQAKSWCAGKNQSAPHQSAWTEYNPPKLNALKLIANDFLASLGAGDQSALISFGNSATMEKTLSSNHAETKNKVNSLTPLGATDIGDAIKSGAAELTSSRIDKSANQIMILLTDGLANKPNGPGTGEWPADVKYALDQAKLSGNQGIKIFTIGLDSDINYQMLAEIAATTSAKYYFTPDAPGLKEIFNRLKSDICQNPPVCGDGVKNGAEACDGKDGVGEHQSCTDNCALINLPYCGNGIKEEAEECDNSDGVGPHQACSTGCALIELPYCGDGVKNGAEQCDDGNLNNGDQCKSDCTLASCQPDINVMMVLDRSGSMGYTSACTWWQLKCVNPPSCSSGYSWTKNTTYNQTPSWCAGKNQSAPHQSVWVDYGANKIAGAKNSANQFLDLLSASDQSGLVSYANGASLDKALSNNHSATKTAVNSLITNGATDIGDAIKLAVNQLSAANADPGAVRAMILLTDGMANKPSGPGYGEYAPDAAYALSQASAAAAAGITIFTIGLGSDVNSAMLAEIAESSGGGGYYFAPTAAELQAIFDQIAVETCQTITLNGLKQWPPNSLFTAIRPKEFI